MFPRGSRGRRGAGGGAPGAGGRGMSWRKMKGWQVMLRLEAAARRRPGGGAA